MSATSKSENMPAGRKGDPRMNLAVAAKLRDPTLSSFEALKIGGFNYDNDLANIDNDNVSLTQRKNQLARRLRHAKSKKLKTSSKLSQSIDNASLTSELEPLAFSDSPQHNGKPRDVIQTSQVLKNNNNSNNNGPLQNNEQQVPPATTFSSQLHVGNMDNNPHVLNQLEGIASRYGITLEEFALRLSRTDSLHIYDNIDNVQWPQITADKKLLALRLAQNERSVLYKTCMLRSGYAAHECTESSRSYTDFAASALQTLQQDMLEAQQSSFDDYGANFSTV